MTMDAPPGGLPQTPEEILQLLKAYEAGGGDISAAPELKDLLNEVQRSQGHAPAAQEGPTEEVTPEPGFVVKTADDTGRKVFVNVCSSHSIAAPGGWENGQIPEEAKQALANLDSVADGADGHEHLRFPLSMGPPGSDVDRRGELCTVFDCIFNSDVLAAARSLRSLKMFLIELALGWISQKHKLTLDPKYKLPKLAYKGDSVRGQRIRAARKPLVSELCDVEEEPEFALLSKPRPPAPTPKPVPPASGCGTAPPSCANTGAAVGRAAQLQPQQQQGISRGVAGSSVAAAPPSSSASLEAPNPAGPSLPFTLQFSGRPAETALLTLDLPPGCSPAAAASPPELHIHLDVDSLGSHVAVEVQGIGHCSVELPLSVTTLGARAELLGGASQLQLSLPFRSVGSLLAEMQARRPHAHGSIGMANREYLELEV